MLCVILRVWEKWVAVVGSEVICVSRQKDRAITLWKAGDARMTRAPIEQFFVLAYLKRRFELIRAEELVGRGKTYRTAMRSGAKLSEADKDEIASAIELVRRAKWAQLPPKFQAYEDACRSWTKARANYVRTALAAVSAISAARASSALAAKARRKGFVLEMNVAKAEAAKFAVEAKRLTLRAIAARDIEFRAAATMRVATAAHLESKQWETRELVAYRARLAASQARAERSKAIARGKRPDADADTRLAQAVENAEALMNQLKEEDDASRCFRALGPVWRVFNM